MKLLSMIAVLTLSSQVYANSDLQSAFADAMKRSESDKERSLTTIKIEDESRMAAWKKRRHEVVVVPTSAAVDMPYTVSSGSEKSPSPQIETDHYVTKELSDIK